MRLKSLLGCLLALALPCSALTTVTAHLAAGDTSAQVKGTHAHFQLMYCGSNQPRVAGVSDLVTTGFDVTPDATGLISKAIYGNDLITCGVITGGTRWRVTYYSNNVASPAADFNITGSTFDLTTAIPVTVAPVVTAPMGDSTYLRLDGGNDNLLNPAFGPLSTPGVQAAINGQPITPSSVTATSVTATSFTSSTKPVFDVTHASYGAKCDGTTDDAAAFRSAFAAMGATPTGVFYVPNTGHPCRLASSVEMNLGYASAPGADAPTLGSFELRMDGAIRPDAGIGTALWVHHGYNSVIDFRIDGGGQWGDHGLKLSNLAGTHLTSHCKDYAGGVWEAIGTGGATATQMSTVESSDSYACGQNFYIYNAVGIGGIADVEDASSAHGSVIDAVGDVSIAHFESDNNADAVAPLIISNSGNIHIGTAALGTTHSSQALVQVTGSAGVTSDVTFQKLFLNGVAVPGQDGLLVQNGAQVSVGDINAALLRYSIQNQGSTVNVKNFKSYASTTHYFATSYGSIHATASDLHVDMLGAVAQSFLVDSSLTSGYLKLSGVNQSGNAGGSADYDIKSLATGVAITLNGFLNLAPSHTVTATVGLPTSQIGYLTVDESNSLANGIGETDGGMIAPAFTPWLPNHILNNNLTMRYNNGIYFYNAANSSSSRVIGMGATNGMEYRAGSGGWGYLEDKDGNPIASWSPSGFNTGVGGNLVYRCTSAGALPLGALTVNATNCGTSVATTLSVD